MTDFDLGTILGVWAHPDDEAWLSAGLMAHAAAAGRRVMCVTATRGEAGFPGDDPRSVTERQHVRSTELAASLEILGVTEHHWLGYRDGECDKVPDSEAVPVIESLIAQIRPDTVLTFGPDGATGHPDHLAAFRWTTRAFERAAIPGSRLLYATQSREWTDTYIDDHADFMMIDGLEPESVTNSELAVWFTCDDELLERKVRAMRAQASQIEPIVADAGLEAFSAMVREEFFRLPRPTDMEMHDAVRALHRRSKVTNE